MKIQSIGGKKSFTSVDHEQETRQVHALRSAEILAGRVNTPDFCAVEFERYGARWCNVEATRFQNHRITQFSFSIDKEHLQLLIQKLTELQKDMQ